MKRKLCISDRAKPEETFRTIAEKILNESCLVIDGNAHRITEIEFYFKSELHPDGFTHGSSDQLTCAQWYYHKLPNGSFKSGTFKGLDLTFAETSMHGGILIRSLESPDGKHIE